MRTLALSSCLHHCTAPTSSGWALSLAVTVSVLSLVLTFAWGVYQFQRTGPRLKVWVNVKAMTLQVPGADESPWGESDWMPSEVTMPAHKWRRRSKAGDQWDVYDPKLEVVVVNVGRAPAQLAQLGIATQRKRSYSYIRDNQPVLPMELAPGGRHTWETTYEQARTWALEDKCLTFQGVAQSTSLARRRSRRVFIWRRRHKVPASR
jgi:hypothetical protein